MAVLPHLLLFHNARQVRVNLKSRQEHTFIRQNLIHSLGLSISPLLQHQKLIDNNLDIIGLASVDLHLLGNSISIHGYVVKDLCVDIEGGLNFLMENDITIRPKKSQILIGDDLQYHYSTIDSDMDSPTPFKQTTYCVHATNYEVHTSLHKNTDSLLDLQHRDSLDINIPVSAEYSTQTENDIKSVVESAHQLAKDLITRTGTSKVTCSLSTESLFTAMCAPTYKEECVKIPDKHIASDLELCYNKAFLPTNHIQPTKKFSSSSDGSFVDNQVGDTHINSDKVLPSYPLPVSDLSYTSQHIHTGMINENTVQFVKNDSPVEVHGNEDLRTDLTESVHSTIYSHKVLDFSDKLTCVVVAGIILHPSSRQDPPQNRNVLIYMYFGVSSVTGPGPPIHYADSVLSGIHVCSKHPMTQKLQIPFGGGFLFRGPGPPLL